MLKAIFLVLLVLTLSFSNFNFPASANPINSTTVLNKAGNLFKDGSAIVGKAVKYSSGVAEEVAGEAVKYGSIVAEETVKHGATIAKNTAKYGSIVAEETVKHGATIAKNTARYAPKVGAVIIKDALPAASLTIDLAVTAHSIYQDIKKERSNQSAL